MRRYAFPIFLFVLLLGLGLVACLRPGTPTSSAAPVRSRRLLDHILIVSIDGLRPDVALRANMPHLRALMADGSFTFWARTTELSITLPSHTSMLTGVTPPKHGITWNTDRPETIYPSVPTLFELAKADGLTTAMAAAKTKFDTLAKPGTVDWLFLPPANKVAPADRVAVEAAAMIRDHQPNLLFVHFGEPDFVGHRLGWGSPAQLAAVEYADAALGTVLQALDTAGLRDQTLIILTADHGGAGKSHGPDDPRSRHIPWIAAGPGVRRNYDLTSVIKLTVNTEDTFATAAYFLGLPRYPYLDGKPITQIRTDLLIDNPRLPAPSSTRPTEPTSP